MSARHLNALRKDKGDFGLPNDEQEEESDSEVASKKIDDNKDDDEIDLEKPLPFKDHLVLKGEGLNPFGHMSRKAKASNPSIVLKERIREEKIKKDKKVASMKEKKPKQTIWFK